jgi:hypothetical protein
LYSLSQVMGQLLAPSGPRLPPLLPPDKRKAAVKLRDCLDSNADALAHGVDMDLVAAALAADELIRNIDVFIFDCDGVLWKGDVPIPGAVQTIARLRVLGKLLFFITNNSSKSRRGFLEKFTKLGFVVYPEGT